MPGLPLRSPVSVLLGFFLRVTALLHDMSEEAPMAFPAVTGFLLVSGCPFPGVTHLRHGAADGALQGPPWGCEEV